MCGGGKLVGKKDEGKLLDNTNMEDVCESVCVCLRVCVCVSFEGLCLCACVLQYV